MIHNFDTTRNDAAIGALLVYAVYRSRDTSRFKICPEMWGRIERAAKGAAKRARTLPEFVERLMPRLSCEALNPRHLRTDDSIDGSRDFLTRVMMESGHEAVLKHLHRETAYCVLLVRERLERERVERETEAAKNAAEDTAGADVGDGE